MRRRTLTRSRRRVRETRRQGQSPRRRPGRPSSRQNRPSNRRSGAGGLTGGSGGLFRPSNRWRRRRHRGKPNRTGGGGPAAAPLSRGPRSSTPREAGVIAIPPPTQQAFTSAGPGTSQAPPGRRLARTARLCRRQRGRRERLLDQPGRSRRAPGLRRNLAQRDLDRPQAPGPPCRAGQDRAAEHRRRALPARCQPETAQGDAGSGHFELRQLRRRRREHGERFACCGTSPGSTS